MRRLRNRTFVAVLSAAALSAGCEVLPSENDPAEVQGTLAEALQALEDAMYAAVHVEELADLDDFSFATARSLFAEVLDAEPGDSVQAVAALGYALSTIFAMEDHPDVRGIADDLEAMDDEPDPSLIPTLLGAASVVQLDPMSLPLDLSTDRFRRVTEAGLAPLTAPVSPPSFAEYPEVGEVKDVLHDVVRPALIEALDHLALIEDPAFEFQVTPRMQGEDEETANSLELDLTEVYAMRTALSVAVAAIQVATAYILEPEPSEDPDDILAAADPSSTFLTLTETGGDELEDAHERLVDATEFLLAALAHLESETDDQVDDIIKFDPTGTGEGVTPEDIADAEEVILDIQDVLTAPQTIEIGGNEEEDEDPLEIVVDLSEFFIDPIEDFKALLPDYQVFKAFEGEEEVALFRWTALNLDEWVIPDPTISGILPEMVTQADLMETFPLDEIFAEASVSGGRYALMSVDETDCFLSWLSEEGGCLVDDAFFVEGEIELTAGDGEMLVKFSAYGNETHFEFAGPYSVTHDAENVYTLHLDLIPGFGDPIQLDATLFDNPGYSHFDEYGRTRGGSRIELEYLGSFWVFEREH